MSQIVTMGRGSTIEKKARRKARWICQSIPYRSLAIARSGQDDDNFQRLSITVLLIKYRSADMGLASRSTLIELSHDRVKYILKSNCVIIVSSFNRAFTNTRLNFKSVHGPSYCASAAYGIPGGIALSGKVGQGWTFDKGARTR